MEKLFVLMAVFSFADVTTASDIPRDRFSCASEVWFIVNGEDKGSETKTDVAAVELGMVQFKHSFEGTPIWLAMQIDHGYMIDDPATAFDGAWYFHLTAPYWDPADKIIASSRFEVLNGRLPQNFAVVLDPFKVTSTYHPSVEAMAWARLTCQQKSK